MEQSSGIARSSRRDANHSNNLVCMMARATEMAAIIKASENRSITTTTY